MVLMHGQQRSHIKHEGAWVDIPGRSRVPSLSTDEVATASPVDAVASASTVGVGDAGATISPPRVD